MTKTIKENLHRIEKEIPEHVTLIVVTKLRENEAIESIYQEGYRHFGENKVQEILRKKDLFPADVQWHLIGHLQSNKVKQIIPFVSLIHSVDSEKLLLEINKESAKISRKTKVLLQVYIATEESKYGLDEAEAKHLLDRNIAGAYPSVEICGLMGMASNVADNRQVEKEFAQLHSFHQTLLAEHPYLKILSMGMSGDYMLAIKNGSNMVRIGSAIFQTN